jgi:hypothetical protein
MAAAGRSGVAGAVLCCCSLTLTLITMLGACCRSICVASGPLLELSTGFEAFLCIIWCPTADANALPATMRSRVQLMSQCTFRHCYFRHCVTCRTLCTPGVHGGNTNTAVLRRSRKHEVDGAAIIAQGSGKARSGLSKHYSTRDVRGALDICRPSSQRCGRDVALVALVNARGQSRAARLQGLHQGVQLLICDHDHQLRTRAATHPHREAAALTHCTASVRCSVAYMYACTSSHHNPSIRTPVIHLGPSTPCCPPHQGSTTSAQRQRPHTGVPPGGESSMWD